MESAVEGPNASNVASVLRAYNAVLLNGGSVQSFAERAIREHALDDNFCMVDLGTVKRLFEAWTAAMPRVRPFYAVKCNPDVGIISMLAALGAGFDCASEGEMQKVLDLGVPGDAIIYAHPIKPPKHLKFAAESGVNLTTFDTEAELFKIAHLHASTACLMRIRYATGPTYSTSHAPQVAHAGRVPMGCCFAGAMTRWRAACWATSTAQSQGSGSSCCKLRTCCM